MHLQKRELRCALQPAVVVCTRKVGSSVAGVLWEWRMPARAACSRMQQLAGPCSVSRRREIPGSRGGISRRHSRADSPRAADSGLLGVCGHRPELEVRVGLHHPRAHGVIQAGLARALAAVEPGDDLLQDRLQTEGRVVGRGRGGGPEMLLSTPG